MRTSRKKIVKKKTRDALHECSMLRIALKTRWHTSGTRVRNAMRSMASFQIIQSRKRRKNSLFNRVWNRFLILKFVVTKTLLMHTNMFFRNTIDQIFNYPCYSFIISDQLTAVVHREKRLTFLAGSVLIISNIEKNYKLTFRAVNTSIISNNKNVKFVILYDNLYGNKGFQ